jgi:hypothetical protein
VAAESKTRYVACGVTEEGEDLKLDLMCASGHHLELTLHARGGRPVFRQLSNPGRREVIHLSMDEARRLGI